MPLHHVSAVRVLQKGSTTPRGWLWAWTGRSTPAGRRASSTASPGGGRLSPAGPRRRRSNSPPRGASCWGWPSMAGATSTPATTAGTRCCGVPAGTVSVYSGGAPGTALRTPNYPVFDAREALRLRLRGLGARRRLPLPHRPRGRDAGGSHRAVPLPERPGPLAGRGLALRRRVDATRGDPPAHHRRRGLGAPEEVVRLPGTVPDPGLRRRRSPLRLLLPPRPHLPPPPRRGHRRPGDAGTALAAPTNVAFLGDGWLGVANLGRWHLAAPGAGPGRPLRYPDLPVPGERP